ncbi:unnamed protein product, partial [Cylicostephanus goldi]
FPDLYPPNTTCTYILDGLQGDQNLEKVILTFEEFAVLSDDDSTVITEPPSLDDITCPVAWVGVATSDATMKATLSSTDESNYESTLCERIPASSPLMGPYVSEGPRMVVQFGTTDKLVTDGLRPNGFKAKVEFKTGRPSIFIFLFLDLLWMNTESIEQNFCSKNINMDANMLIKYLLSKEIDVSFISFSHKRSGNSSR